MDELSQLAERYESDKGPKHHCFTPHYFHHFAPWRQLPLRLLEIGVAGGASLKMWADFFPHATVYGVDNDPVSWHSDHPRITTLLGDQQDVNFWNVFLSKTAEPFDIIIDDGSHRPAPTVAAFEILFPHLKPGGAYAIEDLHSSYWSCCGGSPRQPGTAVEFLKGLIDEMNLWGRCGTGDQTAAIKTLLAHNISGVGFYEANVAAMHFYKSLAVVYRTA